MHAGYRAASADVRRVAARPDLGRRWLGKHGDPLADGRGGFLSGKGGLMGVIFCAGEGQVRHVGTDGRQPGPGAPKKERADTHILT